MGHSRPRRDDIPSEVPVFPLAGALLLPGGRLPLNIFEPRYRAMTEDALGQGRVIGMIQPEPASTDQAVPELYRVGCLGRLQSFSETEDGRYLITLIGLVRFAVAEELPQRRGYRRVVADIARYLGDLQVPATPPELDREALFALLRRYFGRRGFEANWDAIDEMPDDVLITTLCMACPFGVVEKQALLEAPTEVERVAALTALLQIDTHDSDTAGHRVS